MTSVNGEESRVDFAGIRALSSRRAGYSVAAKCLQVQADAEIHDPSLRAADAVKLAPEAWSWYTGAIGEIAVGRLLAELGSDWFVRHAVPIGAGTKDVDHLVIGPGGVFSINTKHHAGASIWVGDHVLRVNNSNTRHLADAIRDRDDVANRLTSKAGFPVTVTAVLALFAPKSVTDKRPPSARPVSVVDAQQLARWLRGQPRRLSETELSLIKFAAEEPETWHVDPRAADTLRVMQRFERLASIVGTPAKPVAPRPSPAAAPSPASSRERVRSRVSSPPRQGRPKTKKRKARATFGDLVKLWITIGLTLAGIAAVNAYISQPCATPTGCAFVPLYEMLTPLLGLAAMVLIGLGALATLIWIIRRTI
jgi:hypothetical protein